jgi:hypothetical protein
LEEKIVENVVFEIRKIGNIMTARGLQIAINQHQDGGVENACKCCWNFGGRKIFCYGNFLFFLKGFFG